MSAYLIANIEVTDPPLFAQYGALVPAMVARFGGRYLVRGGAITNVAPSSRHVCYSKGFERDKLYQLIYLGKNPKPMALGYAVTGLEMKSAGMEYWLEPWAASAGAVRGA